MSAQLMRMVAEMTAVKIATEYFMIVLYIGFVGWMMRCVTRPVGLYLYTISQKPQDIVYTLKRGINSSMNGSRLKS